jgi:hypothetical protein
LPSFVELAAGPEQAACDEIEVNRVLHRVVAVTERGAEHAADTVLVRPDDVMVLLRVLAKGGGQRHEVLPELFVLVELVLGVEPLFGESLS